MHFKTHFTVTGPCETKQNQTNFNLAHILQVSPKPQIRAEPWFCTGPPHLLLRQLSSSLVEVDVGLPQDDVGVTSANTLRERAGHQRAEEQHHSTSPEGTYLDGGDGEGDLPPTIDVRVENTKNVLELLRDDQRLKTENPLQLLNSLQTKSWIPTATGPRPDPICTKPVLSPDPQPNPTSDPQRLLHKHVSTQKAFTRCLGWKF